MAREPTPKKQNLSQVRKMAASPSTPAKTVGPRGAFIQQWRNAPLVEAKKIWDVRIPCLSAV